jgi:hypothetical protein
MSGFRHFTKTTSFLDGNGAFEKIVLSLPRQSGTSTITLYPRPTDDQVYYLSLVKVARDIVKDLINTHPDVNLVVDNRDRKFILQGLSPDCAAATRKVLSELGNRGLITASQGIQAYADLGLTPTHYSPDGPSDKDKGIE